VKTKRNSGKVAAPFSEKVSEKWHILMHNACNCKTCKTRDLSKFAQYSRPQGGVTPPAPPLLLPPLGTPVFASAFMQHVRIYDAETL